jgi:hypothetical protein
MTDATHGVPQEVRSFLLTPAERTRPIPSASLALISVLLTFVHVMLWVPAVGPLGLRSLPVALLAAAVAWVAFFRREQIDGTGWRGVALRAGSRLAVAGAVVISSVFLFRVAAGAVYVNC